MKFMFGDAEGTSDSPQDSVDSISKCHVDAVQWSEKHFTLLIFRKRPVSKFPRAKSNSRSGTSLRVLSNQIMSSHCEEEFRALLEHRIPIAANRTC